MFDESVEGRASDFLRNSNISLRNVVVAHMLHRDYFAVAFTDVGPAETESSPRENINQCLERSRVGAGLGARALQTYSMDEIYVESMSSPEAAAEGSVLGTWDFEGYKKLGSAVKVPKVLPFVAEDGDRWKSGQMVAEGQNLARHISHMAPNVGTPEGIADLAIKMLCPCNVMVEKRDIHWCASKKLHSLIEVAKSSRRPPVMLELTYCGGREDGRPMVLIGDGCTFDSWGLCLRNHKNLQHGMFTKTGAAAVIGIMKAAAQLSLPLNINGLVPLYGNQLGGMALRPGSVIATYNKTTTEVHRTNTAARLVLSDLIGYSETLKPQVIINLATLSVDTCEYFSETILAFTSEDKLYDTFERSSAISGDRVVRGPLCDYYKAKTTYRTLADTRVVPHMYNGDAMAAAMFLQNYKPKSTQMLTLDIGGSAFFRSPKPEHYLKPGLMTGSPVRTVVELLKQIACPNDKPPKCR
ncbi:cytosol aminopeptidase-like [Adelges cooleyi]|uniref:cytosol aminopeptidase-like n=1 Tax=Adelges cooleyi TaxID=133065 RepID=UPI00217FC15B|nr:cytosol aminopeptidase-like [Adelges cooleyi]